MTQTQDQIAEARSALEHLVVFCAMEDAAYATKYEAPVKAALDCLAAIQVDREAWRPIDSAPRDGTRFLGMDGDSVYALAWEYESPDEGYWVSFCGQPVVASPEPTHWRPMLPAPPADGVLDRGEGFRAPSVAESATVPQAACPAASEPSRSGGADAQ